MVSTEFVHSGSTFGNVLGVHCLLRLSAKAWALSSGVRAVPFGVVKEGMSFLSAQVASKLP